MTAGRELWTPDPEYPFHDDTLEQVVKAYAEFLEVRAPDRHEQFQNRVKNNLDAARSEAAVFSWLRAENLSPSLHEIPGKVGADFLCSRTPGTDVLVEVTCLNATAVANKSEWPKLIEEIAGHFAMITPQLMVKRSNLSESSRIAF